MDAESRALFRRFRAGDVVLAERLLRLIDRGVIHADERVGIMAVVFGERLMDALSKANERRSARTVRADRVADQLARGRVPTTIRGGAPPMKRREATGSRWKDPCLETVVRVDHDEAGVRVRACVVLYEGRDSVEVEVDAFTAEKPVALLWGAQYRSAVSTCR